MSYRSGTSTQTALGSLDGSTISSSSIDKFHEIDASDIVLKGQLRKLKRMKKKFFVLRGDSAIHGPARLEYYDNEKKWRHGLPPKRSIVLKTCFSINRKSDSKHKLALALYTRDDCFAVACESEEELEAWLGSMLLLQRGKTETGETPRPTFEHLWQVNVKKKGLGGQQNIVGPYRLCLSATSLTLVKMPHTEPPDTKEFQLMSIRRCGHSDGFFYMELGRSSCTGAGELWMQTEDNTIAQNMHEAILNAMRACVKEDLPPRPRTRSSSATESSKPISVGGRRQTTPGATSLIRDRADSLSSRPRTISEGPNITVAYSGSHPNQSEVMLQMGHRDKNSHLFTPDHQRPTSVYSRAISSSPPSTSVLASPGSIACSTDSASSSLSIDDHDLAAVLTIHHHHLHGGSGGRLSYSHTPENSLPSEPAIVEETDDYMNMAGGSAETNATNGVHAQQPSDMDQGGNYLSVTPKAILASSPVATATCISANRGSKQLSMKSKLGLAHMPLKSAPGSQSAYMDMSSSNASSWSPNNTTDAYMPMAPGEKSGHHTRSSSIGEDVPDGYVPMAPQCIDEHAAYMDMKPRRSLPRDVHVRGRMSPASSCSLASSVTSGTPSLSLGTPPPPLRLADFHLDKVASLLTPSEDDDLPPLGGRPFRAYSVGSRPDHRPKMRLESIPSPEANPNPRVRAFSVGSKRSSNVIARPEIKLGLLPNTAGSSSAAQPRKKSLSAPLLNSSPLPASWQSHSILKSVLFGGGMPSPRTRPGGDLMVVDYNGGHREGDKTKSPHRYVSSDSLGSNSIADREHDDKTGTSYGSSDSLGKASCSSLTPSSRPRSNSKTSFLHRAAGKLESMRRTDKKHHAKHHDIERLESVPQGRDTDYVEYNSCQSPSADEYMPMNAQTTPRSLSRSSSRVSKRSSRNASKEDLQRTSESNSQADDEYVELARPPSVRKASLKEKKRRSQTAPAPSLSTDTNEYLPMEPVHASPHADSAYLDMTSPATRKDPPPANEYLPMSYSDNRTSRPNSLHKSSARNSREIRNEDYMEMTFSPASDLDRLKQKMRGSTPASPDGLDQGTKTGFVPSHGKNSSASSFLSSLLGKKYSAGTPPKIATPPMDDKTGNTLPRSARSMPPSPFSSLKRSKSTKPRLLSSDDPPTPSEDTSPPLYSTGSLKRHSEPKMLHHCPKPGSLFTRTGASPHNPAHYPLTPPSPDGPSNFSCAQLSPPSGGSLRPNSSQPISIVSTGPSLATRRGVNSNDSSDSGPHPPFELYVTRLSASPRQHPPPPLSPLPEVQFPISPCGFEPSPTATPTVATSTASLLPPPPATKLVTSPSATESAYLPMDFRPARRRAPNGLTVPVSLTPSRDTLSPVRDDLALLPSPETDSEKSNTESTPSLNSSVSVSEATTPTKVLAPSAATPSPLGVDKENKENGSFASKLRAASLEKIVVGALDKVRTGINHHRRHNSGDKPRKSSVRIYRSNSYQPTGSRSSVVGLFTPVPSKPAASASSFSTLGDIPDGKLIANEVGSSQLSPGHSKAATKPMVANRLSSSSLASLGEEMALSAELQAVSWAPSSPAPCTIFTCNPHAQASLSPALQANSSSPSPSSSTSRPPSVLGEQQRELHYATLDLAPVGPKDEEAPRSPRLAVTTRPGASFAFPTEGSVSSGLSYAKIDFKKSEGLRNTSSGMSRETRNS